MLDFAKGFVPALCFAAWFLEAPSLLAQVVFGACAVLGHCASPFLGLRGGKGVATTTGVFAAVDWLPFVIALAVFGLVLGISRKVYLGSLSLGLALGASSGIDPHAGHNH